MNEIKKGDTIRTKTEPGRWFSFRARAVAAQNNQTKIKGAVRECNPEMIRDWWQSIRRVNSDLDSERCVWTSTNKRTSLSETDDVDELRSSASKTNESSDGCSREESRPSSTGSPRFRCITLYVDGNVVSSVHHFICRRVVLCGKTPGVFGVRPDESNEQVCRQL